MAAVKLGQDSSKQKDTVDEDSLAAMGNVALTGA